MFRAFGVKHDFAFYRIRNHTRLDNELRIFHYRNLGWFQMQTIRYQMMLHLRILVDVSGLDHILIINSDLLRKKSSISLIRSDILLVFFRIFMKAREFKSSLLIFLII
jgi:hypothetical protein